MPNRKPPHVLVLGAGFGGLNVCKHLRRAQARLTLVDRENHHLFQPLLYQVATAGLSPAEIAQPIRSILSDQSNVTVLMDTVTDVDLERREVVMSQGRLNYDYLVLALGGVTSYFGHPEWEAHAPGLKTLQDAIRIRHDVLLAFEKAENEPDPALRRRWMTLVVVGGGPTGLELAGTFAELARHVLRRDFRHIDPRTANVILLEAAPALLAHFPPDLSESARRQLTELGVEVRTGARVKSINPGRLELESGEVIEAANIIWAAGVGASPLTKKLGTELDRAGRVNVNPDLSLPGHPEVFAIGDMATVTDEGGRPIPGVAPAAMQMARHAARIIEDELAASHPSHSVRPRFRYWDKGTMATIGRSAAVAWMGPLKMTGLPAWLAWLFVHLLFLVGLRNKVVVVLDWMFAYLAYKRGARIISYGPERKNHADASAGK
jgi:NADH:quinone reductase (non-electrogenic)